MPVISTNLAANSAVRYLNINSVMQTGSLSKLASGSRITQASDDAAGLAISTKISSDVTALQQAATNASHGISVLQTADGGASNISDILQRMKALGSQASSGTVTDNERVYIDAEFQQLIQEVDAIAGGSRYNGQSLLDGTSAFAAGINVMVGSDAADVITVVLEKLTSQGLGLKTTDGIADTGIKGNKDAQHTAVLTVAAPRTLAAGTVMDIKINGIDMSITGDVGSAAGIDGIYALLTARLGVVAGEDFTITQPGGAGTDIVITSTKLNAEGKLALTDGSNAALSDTQAQALGFDQASDLGTGGIDGTTANLYIDMTATIPTGVAIDILVNGIALQLVGNANTQAGGAAGMDDIAAQIAAQLTVATDEDFIVTHTAGATDIVFTSIAEGGQLTITNADGTPLNPAQAQSLSLGNDPAYVPANAIAVDIGSYGTVNDSPAFLVGTSTGVSITDDKITFEVNDVIVTLTNVGGTNQDGQYSVRDLVDTINAALVANKVMNVKASIRGGALSIATTTVGAEAKLDIDNFSIGSSFSILGMSPVATGAVAGEGQGTALKAGVQSTASQSGAIAALDVVDKAIAQVSKVRANIGSLESRFGFHQASIATSIENLVAAVSAIRDTDIAQEAAKLASSKVKTQAAVAAAAQASQMPQDLLKLLQ